jgi:ParB/RepB/Spo0J family partition protein
MGQTQTPQEVREIPLSLLEQDPMNIRDAPKIDDEFRDSISKGVIEPLVVRPVSCVEDKKAREKLISSGKQFVVTAGVRRYAAALSTDLKTVPCIVRELNDLEAMCLSIAENRHRKDIPPWRWSEILFDLYNRLDGPKKRRIERIAELTGINYSSIEEYLTIYELPDDFKARLKEPEERSDSEKEAIAARSLAISEEKAPFELPTKAHIEPPKVPERVMVKLVQDEHFKKLIKKDPAKAHELATIATLKGQKRVGEVLRLAKDWKPRVTLKEMLGLNPIKGVDYLDLKLEIEYRLIDKSIVMGLEEYRARHNLPDLKSAAEDILFTWIKEVTHIDYISLPVAIRGVITRFLDQRGYSKIDPEVKK